MTGRPPRAQRTSLLVALVGIVLVGVASAAAARRRPSALEVAVFRAWNDPPALVDGLLGLVDPLLRPVGLTLVVVVLAVAVAITRRAVLAPLAVGAATAGALAYLLDNLLKRLVDRGRPPAFLDDVLLHGYPVSPRGSGFPSSHTAVAVGVVVGAWPWLGRTWRVVAVVVAVAVGLDRMYVGAHLPLDVLGGAGVGLVAGGLVGAAQARWRRPAPSS